MSPAQKDPSPRALWTPRRLAEEIGVHPDTLRRWRREGRGPRALRVGTTYRYQVMEVNRWLREQQVTTTTR